MTKGNCDITGGFDVTQPPNVCGNTAVKTFTAGGGNLWIGDDT